MDHGPEGDVYFYRAVSFAKLYANHGCIEPQGSPSLWRDLAAFVRWPDGVDTLRALFVSCGVVSGKTAEIYGWQETNGWILEKNEREAKRQADKRAAGRASAKARRKKASEAEHAGQPKGHKADRMVGR